jgi:hypothetical protein
MTELLGPLAGAAGGGLVVRIVFTILNAIIESKKKRNEAINQKISGRECGLPIDNPDYVHTANFIANVMCLLFAATAVTCLLFPYAEFRIFLPEHAHRTDVNLLFYSTSWSSDLGKAVLAINSGGVVYTCLMFEIFVMTAFFRGK